MKKIILFVMLLCFPFILNAKEYNYVSENIEESFKAENIKYDLGDYKESEEKVNIYLFRGQGCSHCEDFLTFVSDTLVKDYGNYFNLVSYEVWSNKDNEHLKDKVLEYFGVTSKGVPFIIIGDNFFVGFSFDDTDKIKDTLMEQYNNTERKDIVKKVLEKDDEEVSKIEDEEELGDKPTFKDSKELVNLDKESDSKEIFLMIFLLSITVITASVALIIFFWPWKRKKGKVK